MTLLFWAIWASEQKSGGWIDVRDISWPPAVPNSKTTEDQFVHNAVPRLLLSYFQTRVEHNLNSKHTLTEDFFQISAARSQIWIQICLSDQMVDQFFFSCPSLIPREKRWESAAFSEVYDINSFERLTSFLVSGQKTRWGRWWRCHGWPSLWDVAGAAGILKEQWDTFPTLQETLSH